MRKKIFIILICLGLFSYAPKVDSENYAMYAVYYVAANGSAGNTGTSTGSPWTIEKAIQEAGAGDFVWVEKGIYSDKFLTFSQSGTSSSPITFKGYNNTPGDVNTTTEPSYSYGDVLDGNTLPLFREARSGVIGTGTGITISGNYIVLENIKVQYYATGVNVLGNFNTLKNVDVHDVGNFSNDTNSPTFNGIPYVGRGIRITGSFNNFYNTYVEKCDAEGIVVRNNDNYFENIEVHESQNDNPMDYYFLIQGGSRNVIKNLLVWRHGNLTHYGHGIVLKSPNPNSNNLFENFTINNTNLEVQYQGSNNNIFREGTITRLPDGGGSDNIGGIYLANASHDNHFEDIFVDNTTIRFAGWQDGLPGQELGLSSYNNTFNRITVNSPWFAVAFYFFQQTSWPANNNKFYNCTFHRMANSNFGNRWIFERSRPASGTQFVNCIFSGFTSYGSPRGGSPGYDYTVTWTSNNFFNSAVGSIQGPQTNTTTVDPLFTNANAKDFTLQSGSPLKGQGVATPFLSAGNDIGAAQTGGGPPADVTAPSITEVVESQITETSIQVEFRFNEGSTGRIEWGPTTSYGNFTTLETNYLTFHRQTITGLSPGTLYYYRILGGDAAGNTVTGSQRSATTLGTGENPDPEPVSFLGELRGLFLKAKRLF